VMNDHVVGALHESRVNREEWTKSFGGEPAGKQRRMFFSDADIEVAVGQLILEGLQFGSAGHRGGDRDDFWILLGEIRDDSAENFRTGWCGGGIGGAIFDVVGS